MADSTKPEIETFKPGWRLWGAFISIGIVNLACALDATTVSVALPVRRQMAQEMAGSN
jgi:hypothetical protein